MQRTGFVTSLPPDPIGDALADCFTLLLLKIEHDRTLETTAGIGEFGSAADLHPGKAGDTSDHSAA